MANTVCVIGAGVAGITAVKHCLDENLQPTCYEKDNDIGGLWNYKDVSEEGRSSLYKSCVLNTSKATTSFSDFPFPKGYPNFMHHSLYRTYLNAYIEHFNLRPRFKLYREVIAVKKCKDFKETGRWCVTVKNLRQGVTSDKIFDFVIVCNGHFYKPLLPPFPGMDKFQGKIMHSHDYKTFHGFEGKRVLVIGIGNSGADVGCEVSRHAQHVYMSTRRGTYVLQRTVGGGVPWDHVLLRRAFFALPKFLRIFILFRVLNSRCNNKKYGLSPNHPCQGNEVTISDDLVNRILVGSLSVKSNVREFKGDGVIFDDGCEVNVDVVVFATGYRIEFPFLDDSILTVDDRVAHLYKQMLPFHHEQTTLGVVGLVAAFSPVPPLCELQSRWIVRVFKGHIKLPSRGEMEAIFEEQKANIEEQVGKESRYTLQVDYFEYVNDIAGEIGCRPDLKEIFLRDRPFWKQLVFGPLVPQQWRLVGPGKWDGAEESIRSVDESTWRPMKTRVAGENETDGLYLPFVYTSVGVLIIMWLLSTLIYGVKVRYFG
ncbi:hypothetical protein ScPMuIL_014637 [Solemya velum]